MEPTLTFPVIRGLQAQREYYVAMWTLRTLCQISIFNESELPPELRAQRILNRARIPEIAGYILDNPKDYVFSALTVSIDSKVNFETLPGQEKLGLLQVPMNAKFIINDGQHRRASIIEALEQRPELAHETIAVVFFLDIGLERCQQMFADLNRYAIRPSRSIGLLYDHRNDKARLAKLVVLKSKLLRDIVDMEKSSLAPRARKLFTLSAFYNACSELVQDLATGELPHDADLAREFWEEVAKHFPVWAQVQAGKLPASDVREAYVHGHALALHALGRAGNSLLKASPKGWRGKLAALAKINWSRSDAELWEGRAMMGGKMAKTSAAVFLTTNVVKEALQLPRDENGERAESARAKSKPKK